MTENLDPSTEIKHEQNVYLKPGRRQGVLTLNCDFIESFVINAQSKSSAFFQ